MESQELFNTLKNMAQEASVDPGLEAVVVFDLTGPDPVQWTGRLENGRASLEEGAAPEADLTVTAAYATALGLFQKTVNPMAAFMTGKIKVKGDVAKIAALKAFALNKKK